MEGAEDASPLLLRDGKPKVYSEARGHGLHGEHPYGSIDWELEFPTLHGIAYRFESSAPLKPASFTEGARQDVHYALVDINELLPPRLVGLHHRVPQTSSTVRHRHLLGRSPGLRSSPAGCHGHRRPLYTRQPPPLVFHRASKDSIQRRHDSAWSHQRQNQRFRASDGAA